MGELYKSVINLLGRSNESQEFAQFASEYPPSANYSAETNTIYDFSNHGFGLAYDIESARFWMASFELSTKAVKTGAMESFKEPLASEIFNSDGPKDIEIKLRVKPQSLAQLAKGPIWRGIYIISPYCYECLFERMDGPLLGMTVRLAE